MSYFNELIGILYTKLKLKPRSYHCKNGQKTSDKFFGLSEFANIGQF